MLTLLTGCLLLEDRPGDNSSNENSECVDSDCTPYLCDDRSEGECTDYCDEDSNCADGYYCCRRPDDCATDDDLGSQCIEE